MRSLTSRTSLTKKYLELQKEAEYVECTKRDVHKLLVNFSISIRGAHFLLEVQKRFHGKDASWMDFE